MYRHSLGFHLSFSTMFRPPSSTMFQNFDLRTFYDEKVVLRPDEGSFTADGQGTRLSNKDLDPVPASQKKWEWYHVSGFWIAEGFSVVQMQIASSAVSVGLNPGLAIAACTIGNFMVTVPCCITGWLGAKVSAFSAYLKYNGC